MVTQHQVWDLSSYITASTHLFCFRCVPGVHNSGALMGTAPSCLSLSIFKSISDYKCNENKVSGQFSSVQLLICIQLFATTCIVAHQASLSITNCQSLPKLMSIESVMPSNHLILCYPLLLLPSIFPNIRVFSNESALRIRWPKYWSFSFNISPSN